MAPRISAAAGAPRVKPAPVDRADPSGEFPKMIYGPKGAQQIVKDADEQAKYAKIGFVEHPDDVVEPEPEPKKGKGKKTDD
jgi:hypothetical protein